MKIPNIPSTYFTFRRLLAAPLFITAAITISIAAVTAPKALAAFGILFVVNSAGDEGDPAPGNGVCETATGNGVCYIACGNSGGGSANQW